MPKIRDLGINVIPATTRLLEGAIPMNLACRGETCTAGTSGQCVPSCKAPSVCAAATPKKYETTGFSAEVIAQLRQQLHHHIAT